MRGCFCCDRVFEHPQSESHPPPPPPRPNPAPSQDPLKPSSTTTGGPHRSHPRCPAGPSNPSPDLKPASKDKLTPRSYTVEIACISFLVMFGINFFTGKHENENIALAWATKFATKDSIFEKNFSLLGVGEGDDSLLLLKEGQNVFNFYASGRRFCQGLQATMELKSRHDLILRMYNLIVPCHDEITFDVYMNDDAMDNVIFAVAKKKAAKGMQKEVRDLQRFAGLLSPPGGRKWVADELAIISEAKEVAGDLITEAVLDQVLGDKAFEKFGKGFISMHFSDEHSAAHKKVLLFNFALPDANQMVDLTRLVGLIPYYIDLVGRYKLSSQARSHTEKEGREKRMLEEAEAKLSAESLRKKEAKERARQMKKAMPKMKMTCAH
ncbi:hypothetical protein ACJRO7_036227 [Eucalyptus globulus]|uniref:Uncharacterized protein n=1 Tax=Eucalyptus globulus TaxID=34317 RepID=A0ABD3JKJ3_EUCGL